MLDSELRSKIGAKVGGIPAEKSIIYNIYFLLQK